MNKPKLSREEIDAESRRLGDLIEKASAPGIEAVKEMAKTPLTIEQMRDQVRRHQEAAAKGWIETPYPGQKSPEN